MDKEPLKSTADTKTHPLMFRKGTEVTVGEVSEQRENRNNADNPQTQ